MSHNLPDDIGDYDHDPRSPFYDDRGCDKCREAEEDYADPTPCKGCGNLKHECDCDFDPTTV